jgi:hypothetical protein
MRKNAFLIFAAVIIAVFSASSLMAGPAKAQKAMHADKNKDGRVDKKEMRMEKKWEHGQRAKVNTWWEKKADTNGDGTMSQEERDAWKKLEKERIDLNNDGVIDAKERRLCWRHGRSKVNTKIERQFDANGDGWFQPEEVKAMLKAKSELVKTKGKAKVDSDIEKEYDEDSNGVIDAKEAANLKQDTE